MMIRIATFAALLGLLGIGFATLPGPAEPRAKPAAHVTVDGAAAVHGVATVSSAAD